MTQQISLHHVTVMDVSPPELISIAAELGLKNVCLFTCITPETLSLFPVEWTPALIKETSARLKDLGVVAHNLEWFDVMPESDEGFLRRGLELGASFGARTATTHVVDTDPQRAGENFARFCDVAGEYGLTPCIEFTPLFGTPTLPTALDVIDRAGHPNSGIALDTLHLFRSGGTVADIAALKGKYIRSMQISDGPIRDFDMAAYGEETLFERMPPGDGGFPLVELVQYLPDGLIVDVEVPLRSLAQKGVSPLERARRAVDGARRVFGLH